MMNKCDGDRIRKSLAKEGTPEDSWILSKIIFDSYLISVMRFILCNYRCTVSSPFRISI